MRLRTTTRRTAERAIADLATWACRWGEEWARHRVDQAIREIALEEAARRHDAEHPQ